MHTAATLKDHSVGQSVFVLAVGAPEAERKRLESLGILPGTEVSLLANNNGQVLVSVGETRVAVERDLAALVVVA